MGEYAIDQMMRDYKAFTGTEADRSMFEEEPRPKKPITKFFCKCGRGFKSHDARQQHIGDKHENKS
jgi:hypothetical protein